MEEQRESAQRTQPRRPALIFFGARTSGRSRRVEAYLAQVLQHRHNHQTFRFYHVDGNDRPDLVQRFHVEKLPTLVVVDRKRVRARLEDPKGIAPITRLLEPWLR